MAKKRKQIQIPQNWQDVAWGGIRVKVPPSWTPGALSAGDEGYLRLDDDTGPRLEMKWARAKGFVDVDRIVNRFLRRIGRQRGQNAHVDERADLPVRFGKERTSVRFFHWRADTEGWGAAWLCRECSKAVIVQVTGRPGAVRDEAAAVISSIRDHPDGPWVPWAIYDFRCEMPQDFELIRQELKAGLFELEFERRQERVYIARWGMADVALRKASLEEFLRARAKRRWRDYDVKLEPTEVHGHNALAISGTAIIPWQRLYGTARRLLGKTYPDSLRGAAWLCPVSNKIFHVEAVIDPSQEGLAAEVIERLVCHA